MVRTTNRSAILQLQNSTRCSPSKAVRIHRHSKPQISRFHQPVEQEQFPAPLPTRLALLYRMPRSPLPTNLRRRNIRPTRTATVLIFCVISRQDDIKFWLNPGGSEAASSSLSL